MFKDKLKNWKEWVFTSSLYHREYIIGFVIGVVIGGVLF